MVCSSGLSYFLCILQCAWKYNIKSIGISHCMMFNKKSTKQIFVFCVFTRDDCLVANFAGIHDFGMLRSLTSFSYSSYVPGGISICFVIPEFLVMVRSTSVMFDEEIIYPLIFISFVFGIQVTSCSFFIINSKMLLACCLYFISILSSIVYLSISVTFSAPVSVSVFCEESVSCPF